MAQRKGKKDFGSLGESFKCWCGAVGSVVLEFSAGFSGEYAEEHYRCEKCGTEVSLSFGSPEDLEEDHKGFWSGNFQESEK